MFRYSFIIAFPAAPLASIFPEKPAEFAAARPVHVIQCRLFNWYNCEWHVPDAPHKFLGQLGRGNESVPDWMLLLSSIPILSGQCGYSLFESTLMKRSRIKNLQHTRFSRLIVLFTLTLVGCVLGALTVQAQLFKQRDRPLLRKLFEPQSAQSAAFSGTPFGVGVVQIDLPPGSEPSFFDERAFELVEKSGRVFYAAHDHQPIKALARELIAQQIGPLPFSRPPGVKVYFLFTGNEPLELTLYTPTPVQIVLTPRVDVQALATQVQKWWEHYTHSAAQAMKESEYPRVLDQFLVSSLSRRLQLPLPKEFQEQHKQPSEIDRVLGVLLGTESARLALQQESLALPGDQAADPAGISVADQPLPAPFLQPSAFADVAPQVKDAADKNASPSPAIEPLAAHVPAECFYIRFGSFKNFQWFRTTLDQWGGDLRNLVAFRGLNHDMNSRIENQLSMREGALSKMLGPSVIEDVALIGHDTFFLEGAGFGLLFHAKSNFLLSRDINGHRREALTKDSAAKEETLTIAGQKVSFIHSFDNHIRSFYATVGDFHLVTNSQALMESFLSGEKSGQTLARDVGFQQAQRAFRSHVKIKSLSILGGAFLHTY